MLNGLHGPLLAVVLGLISVTAAAEPAAPRGATDDGTIIRVMLIPADGGTADGTKADFAPLFDALQTATGLRFDIRTGQSYAAVIEGMCAGHADIAWFGPVSYQIARDKGCAELLAVETRDGAATYYSGLFVNSASDIRSPGELAGHSLALGSMHSASSFAYPLAMLEAVGVDPLTDLASIRLVESHANSLMALAAGQVDAAGASFVSFERAVNQGGLQASAFRVIARSDPIPNPPLAIRQGVPSAVRDTLRDALATLHERTDVEPADIRGYGGKPVDRYDVTLDDRAFDAALSQIDFIDEAYKAAILRRSGRASVRPESAEPHDETRTRG